MVYGLDMDEASPMYNSSFRTGRKCVLSNVIY
jgi:hypothetical protein